LTTLGVVPNASYATIYDDPRCFWIEETTYEVDTATLTLASASDFNVEHYMGRLIGGKRIIKDAG
jgi:elongation factor P--beta-lysine ligase